MILTDFHIHSTFSDGKLTIPEIVDLYGSQGFGAIAITDHLCEEQSVMGKSAAYLGRTLTRATFPLYQEILASEAERARRIYGMLLIPGFELTKNSLLVHRAAHVLALGVTTWISADQSLPKLAEDIRELGGFAIAAHPIDPGPLVNAAYALWSSREELKYSFDAWETTNGPRLLPEVMKTGLPKIATSDFHHLGHFSSYKTFVNAEKNQDAVFDAIRAQDISIEFIKGLTLHDGRSDDASSLGLSPFQPRSLRRMA